MELHNSFVSRTWSAQDLIKLFLTMKAHLIIVLLLVGMVSCVPLWTQETHNFDLVPEHTSLAAGIDT